MFIGTFVCSFLHGCTSGGAFQERPGDRGLRGRKETRSRAPLLPVYRNSKANEKVKVNCKTKQSKSESDLQNYVANCKFESVLQNFTCPNDLDDPHSLCIEEIR